MTLVKLAILLSFLKTTSLDVCTRTHVKAAVVGEIKAVQPPEVVATVEVVAEHQGRRYPEWFGVVRQVGRVWHDYVLPQSADALSVIPTLHKTHGGEDCFYGLHIQ